MAVLNEGGPEGARPPSPAAGPLGTGALPLVDQHCHGVVRGDLGLAGFESYLTESDAPAAPGTTYFDSQLGFAVRRWCAPLLDLDAHSPPALYVARRRDIGAAAVTRTLLRASGIRAFLVDTGIPEDLTGPGELAAADGAEGYEVARLERLAEQAAEDAGSADGFAARFADAVAEATRTAVGFKSIAAYRHGLHLDPRPPGPGELRAATGRWLAARERSGPGGELRLTDPVLLRHLVWTAAGTGLPLQFHTGFGDPHLRLHLCDPLLLADLIHALRPTGCPVVLLHGYPYHRNAAYLAAVHPHVYADVGLTLGHTGVRAEEVLAEVLELAPFGKVLFSTDAYGLPELYVVGAEVFRRAVARLFSRWVAEGAWSLGDARRVAAMIAGDNARRVYGLTRGS